MAQSGNSFAGLKFGARTAKPSPEPTPEPAPEPAPDPRVDTAAAAESERRLEAVAAEYTALLPAIEAAQPVRGTVEVPKPLTGTAYAVDAWKRLLSDPAVLAEWGIGTPETHFRSRVTAHGTTVTVEVEAADPAMRLAIADRLIQLGEKRGNLGRYSRATGNGGRVNLYRESVEDPTFGWRENPKTAAFYPPGPYRQGIWKLCGLEHRTDRQRQYPQCTFSADERGGIVTLTLPQGMLPKQVQAAEQSLRQALAMPELTVTVDGLNPVIHLNQKKILREFPKVNPLRPSLFTRPRTEAERYAAAADFVIPLGVRADGTPLLVNQAAVPHLGLFGGTSIGKTVLTMSIVRAACLQSAETLIIDAKNGKDLRKVARDAHDGRLPGVVHYAAGSDAELHRAVLYAHDELSRRKALAQKLALRGIDYSPTPMLVVFDEAPAWLDAGISGADKVAKKAAEETLNRLSYLAAQARESRIFLLVAGQHSYVSAFSGKWRANTSTLAVLGPPTQNHLMSLFEAGERRDEVKKLGATLTKSMKGRGIVVDQETGSVEMFQGFYTPPGRDLQVLESALAQAPKLRRFSAKFPVPGEEGGDGSWTRWSPVSDPSSDDLPMRMLDLPDGSADPLMKRFDPVDPAYDPGANPIPARHISSTDDA